MAQLLFTNPGSLSLKLHALNHQKMLPGFNFSSLYSHSDSFGKKETSKNMSSPLYLPLESGFVHQTQPRQVKNLINSSNWRKSRTQVQVLDLLFLCLDFGKIACSLFFRLSFLMYEMGIIIVVADSGNHLQSRSVIIGQTASCRPEVCQKCKFLGLSQNSNKIREGERLLAMNLCFTALQETHMHANVQKALI